MSQTVGSGISQSAQRALNHITGRTRSGLFACRLWDMSPPDWKSALDELIRAGHAIDFVHGSVADDPTVLGGWVLR